MITEVAAALIRREGKFMICRRPSYKARGDLWEFVGGKVEAGESREEALKRECREELDIEIRVHDLFYEVVHEYPDITVHLSLFEASIEAGEPRLLEHQAMAFIDPSEIENYEFCPADLEILAEIKKRFK